MFKGCSSPNHTRDVRKTLHVTVIKKRCPVLTISIVIPVPGKESEQIGGNTIGVSWSISPMYLSIAMR